MSVYFYGCISLDGYLATKDHDLTWLYESGTTESTGYDKFYEQMDIVMMGRKTFNEILKVGKPYQFYPRLKTMSLQVIQQFVKRALSLLIKML